MAPPMLHMEAAATVHKVCVSWLLNHLQEFHDTRVQGRRDGG
jgi:hypothetical protein